MTRYMIATHPRTSSELQEVGGRVVNKQPAHDLMQSYHWIRLDEEHILMLGNYSVGKHTALHNHDKLSIMSHVGSNKTIHTHMHKNITHAHKEKHMNALHAAFGIDDTHTIDDLVDAVVAVHGPLFSVDK